MEKRCSKCNVVKDVSEYYKNKTYKDGYFGACKECVKLYMETNKEKLKEKSKKYREANKEKKKEYDKLYNKARKDKRKQYDREYYKANKERIDNLASKYVKSRRKEDSLYKLTKNTRRAVARFLEGAKSKRTREIIGLDYKEFQDYLGNEYLEGMHLDHIIPQSWAINDEEVYTLNHYSNFQIITAEENLVKSDTYCKSENLKKVLDNHNNLAKLNKIIERNKDKIE